MEREDKTVLLEEETATGGESEAPTLVREAPTLGREPAGQPPVAQPPGASRRGSILLALAEADPDATALPATPAGAAPVLPFRQAAPLRQPPARALDETAAGGAAPLRPVLPFASPDALAPPPDEAQGPDGTLAGTAAPAPAALPFRPAEATMFLGEGTAPALAPAAVEATLAGAAAAPGPALPFRSALLVPASEPAREPVSLGPLPLPLGAAVQAEIWRGGATLEAILARHGVTEATWREHCSARARALREEAEAGGSGLCLALYEALRSAAAGPERHSGVER